MADFDKAAKALQQKQQALEVDRQLHQNEQARLETARQMESSLEEQKKLYQKELEVAGKIANNVRQMALKHGELARLAQQELSTEQSKSEVDSKRVAALQQIVSSQSAAAAAAAEENRALERGLELRRKATDQLEKIRSKTQALVTTLTGIDAAWKDTFIGSITSAARETGNFKAVASATFAAFSDATSFGNILGSTFMKVQESTIAMVHALDASTAAFRKATGAGKEYTSAINAVFEANRTFGIGLQESAQAFQALYSSMSGFTGYASAFRNDLVGISTLMEKIGINASTFGRNFDTMTKSFGMSAAQAKQFSLDYAQLGRTIGIPPEKLATALSTLASRMAMFGSAAESELRKLAAQSKATGLEMQKLQGIAKGFDTFSDAAQRVGQLNALLGGPYLNTIKMMMATDTERNAILKRVITTTGQLGSVMAGSDAKARMFKKALADIGGFGGDVDAMMRMLSSDLQGFSSDAMRATGSMSQLQRQAMDNTTAMEKFTLALTRFSGQLERILNVIHPILDGLANMADRLGGWFVPALIGASGAIKLLMIPLTSFVGSISAGAAGVGGLTAGVGSLSAGMGGLAAGSAAVALPIAAFGAAIALVGAGIWAAAQGTTTMANAFKTMDDIDISKLVADVGAMTGQIRALGAASEGAYASVGSMGQSMRTISASAGASVSGMTEFTTAMSIFASATTGKVSAFSNFNNELYRMVSGVSRLVALSEDLRTLPLANLTTMANNFQHLMTTVSGNSMESAVANLSSMSRAAAQIANVTAQIDTSKTNVMQQVAQGIKATVEAAVKLSAAPEAVDATNRIAAAASRYAQAISESRNLQDPLRGLIETIRSSIGVNNTGGGGGGGGGGGVSNIVMKMNDRVFASAVVDVLRSGEFNLVQR